MLKLKIISQEEDERIQRENERLKIEKQTIILKIPKLNKEPKVMNTENINSNNIEGKYTIGESPLELMDEAVKSEYENGIFPLVSSKITNVRNMSLERYSALLAIYCMQKFGKGELSICPDGCSSDLMFSLNNEKYMGIQIKSTSGYSKDMYWKFSKLNKNYKGLLIFLHSVRDGVSWLFPYYIFTKFYQTYSESLFINAKKNSKRTSKIDWDIYRVETKDISSKIHEYYSLALNGDENLKIHKFEEITLPIGETTQKEHKAHNKILPFLEKTNLEIIKPKLEGMVYDCIIGKLKVQEKTATKDKGLNSLTASIYRSLKVPYIVSDFDILLINNPAPFESFYFIPMIKLYEHGYIKTTKEEKGKKSLALYPPEKLEETKKDRAHEWTLNYLCYFEDPNLTQRLLEIYNKQINKDLSPVILKDSIFWDIECKNFNDIVVKWNLNRQYAKENLNFHFLLDEKRIAEKSIRLNSNGNAFLLLICVSKNRRSVPCKEGDFDFVYAELPKKYNGFYLIPSIKFKEKDILETETVYGMRQLTIHFPEKIVKGCSLNRDFVFYFNEPDIKEKLTNLLQKY
jgi:hypothetical protein